MSFLATARLVSPHPGPRISGFRRLRVVAVFLLLPMAGSAQDEAKKTFFLPKSPVAAAYVLGRLSNNELIEAPRSEFVFVALLQRKGLDRKYRIEAHAGLAKRRNSEPLTECSAALGGPATKCK